MFRRFAWFVSGMVAGVSAFVWARNKVEDVRRSLTPTSVARRTWESGATVARRLREAVAVGADIMRNGPSSATAGTTQSTQRRRHIASRPNRTHG